MAIDHFEKQAYKPNQVNWNFNVVFDNQPAVAHMVEQYAPLLKHPGLYHPIPPQWLHSTILTVGATEKYSETEMLAVAVKLQESVTKLVLPEFSFDSWWLWGGNVVLHISPDDKFTELYNEVRAAMQSVVGSSRTPRSPHGNFVAHTGLAYAKTHSQEHEIHKQLVAQPIKPIRFKATNIPLLRQWATNGHYEWEIAKDIRIG